MRKKNGEKCTSFVNMGDCEYCVYHVQKEYKMFSSRSELQSPSAGKLHDLRNKVLGKNEVFYGGKSFVASKKSTKVKQKDEQRLKKLSDFFESSPRLETNFTHSPPVSGNLSLALKVKDADRLSKLMDSPCAGTSRIAASTSQSVLKSNVPTRGKSVLQSLHTGEKKNEATPSQIMQHLKFSQAFVTPKLGRGTDGAIDLDCSFSKTQKNRAMSQALLWVKKNGPLKRDDPNAVKKDDKADISKGKRKREEDKGADAGSSNQNRSPNIDKSKEANKSGFAANFSAEKMKEIMEKTSKHTALLEIADLEAEDKYFDNLEKKEQMEEKMLTTYKLECKAVRCLKCKYLAFSASDLCKSEGHPLKVINTMKRFFKCHDCGNRTISLELFPVKPCTKCGGGHWEKTAMMRERKGPVLPSEKLSLRGNEETFVGSVQNGSLNLLVPE